MSIHVVLRAVLFKVIMRTGGAIVLLVHFYSWFAQLQLECQ